MGSAMHRSLPGPASARTRSRGGRHRGPRRSGAQLVQRRAGDDAGDVSAVIVVGQTPGELVEVGDVAVGRSERGPHQVDVPLLATFFATFLAAFAGDLAAGLGLLEDVVHASPSQFFYQL